MTTLNTLQRQLDASEWATKNKSPPSCLGLDSSQGPIKWRWACDKLSDHCLSCRHTLQPVLTYCHMYTFKMTVWLVCFVFFLRKRNLISERNWHQTRLLRRSKDLCGYKPQNLDGVCQINTVWSTELCFVVLNPDTLDWQSRVTLPWRTERSMNLHGWRKMKNSKLQTEQLYRQEVRWTFREELLRCYVGKKYKQLSCLNVMRKIANIK